MTSEIGKPNDYCSQLQQLQVYFPQKMALQISHTTTWSAVTHKTRCLSMAGPATGAMEIYNQLQCHQEEETERDQGILVVFQVKDKRAQNQQQNTMFLSVFLARVCYLDFNWS